MTEVLIPYASHTGTRRNLNALRAAGWRLLLSGGASSSHHNPMGFPYAIDNGAWSAYIQGKEFNAQGFEALIRKAGAGADWAVLPDIVAGGHLSLELSVKWMRRVLNEVPMALLAVQDGMGPDDVRGFLGDRVGIFVGGTTPFKLNTMEAWAALGREVGCWVHVGRVNTAKRIRACSAAGVTSFDGTSASRYAVTVGPLDSARRQLSLLHRG